MPTVPESIVLDGPRVLIDGAEFPHYIGTHVDVETLADDWHVVTVSIPCRSFQARNLPEQGVLNITRLDDPPEPEAA